jgi:hypothetical protein
MTALAICTKNGHAGDRVQCAEDKYGRAGDNAKVPTTVG